MPLSPGKASLQDLSAATNVGNSVGDHRFVDHGELRYALRSIEEFAPWIRRVYLVTDDQQPSWLNTDHPKLRVVSHQAIFADPSQLPAFNSFAIETQLFNIPDLAEYVIIMNDDMMFGGPQRQSSWVSAGRGPVAIVEEKNVVLVSRYRDPDHPLPSTKPVSEWDALDYSTALLNQRFGERPRGYVSHMPIIVETRLAREALRHFLQQVHECAGHRFRGVRDIHIKFLLTHYRIERFREELFYEGLRRWVDTDHDGRISFREFLWLQQTWEPKNDIHCSAFAEGSGSAADLSFHNLLVACPTLASNVSHRVLSSEDPGGEAMDSDPAEERRTSPWHPYRYFYPEKILQNFFISVSGSPGRLDEALATLRSSEPDTICINDDTGSPATDKLRQKVDDMYRHVHQALSVRLGAKSSYER